MAVGTFLLVLGIPIPLYLSALIGLLITPIGAAVLAYGVGAKSK